MINKVAFSKAIKESKKKDKIFSSVEYVSNGYWIFKKDEVVTDVLVKEFLMREDFIYESKEMNTGDIKIPDFKNFIEQSLKEQEFEFSGLIEKTDSCEFYIFVGKEDNKTVFVNRKYVEIIEDLRYCTILGGKSQLCGLTFFSEKSEFIGLILPIRPSTTSDFVVTRREQN